jgi:uncharacterized protein YcbX
VTGSAGPLGTVLGLARYPVKSMAGEDLDEARVDDRGLAGDRSWAVCTDDGGIGSGKTTRRFRRVDGLLRFGATAPGPVPAVEFPTGERLAADDPATGRLLSAALGRALTLRPEDAVPHHDESAVHVVTTGALRRLGERLGGPVEPARFRANVLLDTDEEHIEDGRELRLGADVVLRLGPGMPRCVMVDLPQQDLARDGRILKALGEGAPPVFGLQASVVRGGTVRRGDAAVLL